MRQVLQNLRSGDTKVVEVPIPTPRPGTALVRVSASLVSAGTERMLVSFAEKSLIGKARARPDLARQVLDKARREGLLTTLDAAINRLDQPMSLGYSTAGTIVSLGEGLQGYVVGQRVACAGGGYAAHAEYNVVPQNLLTALPDEVDFESAAFTTLGAIALHGFRLAEAHLGERVAVIGLGLLGLLAVQIARAGGCSVLGIDLDERRVGLAHELGAQAVLRGAAEETGITFSNGRGVDAVLICADTSSDDPVTLAGDIARDRARVVAVGAVGLNLPRKVYYEKELAFINSRSYGPGRYDPAYEEQGLDYPLGYVRWTEGRNLEAFAELIASRRVDVQPLITHRFPIQKAAEAYDLITGKAVEPFLGVLLTYELQVQSSKLKVENQQEEPPNLQPSTLSPSTFNLPTCNLGVLGAGNFASAVLLPVLKKIPGVGLVGVASASGVSAAHAARRFSFRFAVSDESQIIHDPAINTVAILTRHGLHARQVVEALSAGKHVFCEKPLAITPEQLSEIRDQIALRTPHSALLMVGFNRRFAPLAQKMQAFLSDRQEPLVAHYRINAGYLPPTHWTQDPVQGGGRIIGEGCHFVDFLTFLVGAPPVTVEARALPDAGRYVEDNVVLSLTFPDNSLGTVSYLANGDKSFPKERVEVFAGGRVTVLDDFRTLEMVHAGQRQTIRSRLRQDKGHAGEWQAFVGAIHSGGPPPIPYEHLFSVTAATFAAVQSLRCGERVPVQG